MFDLTLPWWELVVRGGGLYLMVLLMLRVSGKRELGQLAPFDLVLLLLISEGISPALTAGDESWTASAIVVTTMLLLNAGMGLLSRWRPAERVIEGRPRFLLRDGHVDYKTLRSEQITHNDLLSALRENGCFKPSEAEYAVLETSGKISVKKRET